MSPALKEAPAKSQEQEAPSPLAGGEGGYKSDFLEQEKEERARVAGLRSDQLSSMRGEDQVGEDQNETIGDNIEEDQTEMEKKSRLRIDQQISKNRQKAVGELKKRGEQVAQKATTALIQKGFNATVAAFLGSIVGIIFGWALAVYRVVAADFFQKESQKFDNIYEKLIYYLIVILGVLALALIFGLAVMLFIGQYGWIIVIYNWFN